MYFNEKSDTNIDNELGGYDEGKRISFDFNKYKKVIIIGGVVLLLIIIIIILATKNRYYITLSGDSEMIIYKGNEYVEPGYKAYDKKNNDLTELVEVNNQVDSSNVGKYTVTYTYGKVTKVRSVEVVDGVEGNTHININGDVTVNLRVGDSYQELGCTAIDTIDNDISDKVKIDSNVDTSKEGNYRVIYSVVNSTGVTTSATRTVIVSIMLEGD